MTLRLTTLFLLLSLSFEVFAFIAYECGGSETNYTAISIVEVQRCAIDDTRPIEEEVVIQLLQPRAKTDVMAFSCKVEVNYVVFHCGMHSHASIAHGGIVSKVIDTTRDQCITMHKERIISMYGHRINGLTVNGTISTDIDFAGWIDSNKACTPAPFIDGNRNWGTVVATGSITISLQEHLGTIDMESRKIHFRTGSVCSLTDDTCIDNDYGPTFWSEYTKEDCRRDSFHVLFRGSAKKVSSYHPRGEHKTISTYTMQNDQNLFTLTSIGLKQYCFLELRNTDHPKLFIHEVKNENWYFKQENIPALDMDMFMYVNTKFMHLEKAVARNMISMYQEIVSKRCELERKMLETRMSLAAVSPLEFAYEHMGKPGFTATILGEAIFIIQCTPVEVTAMHVTECTSEMPVLYKNQTMYMRARSRILQSTGTPVSCTGVLRPQYRINGEWFSTTPSLHLSNGPTILAPGNPSNWSYTSAGNLAAAGIYTSQQMDSLREQIMSPIERRTKSERFAGLLNSEDVSTGGLDLRSIANTELIKEQISKFWQSTWGFATDFGTISAGLIGIVFIFRFLKFMVDTVVHALSLHEVYGCTWHVIGSVWDAFTTYLLTSEARKKKSKRNKNSEPKQDDLTLDVEKPIAQYNEENLSITSPTQFPSLYPKNSKDVEESQDLIRGGVVIK